MNLKQFKIITIIMLSLCLFHKTAYSQFDLTDTEESKPATTETASSPQDDNKNETITSIFQTLSSSLFKSPKRAKTNPKTPPKITKKEPINQSTTTSNSFPSPPPPSTSQELDVTGYDYDVEYADNINEPSQEEGLLAKSPPTTSTPKRLGSQMNLGLFNKVKSTVESLKSGNPTESPIAIDTTIEKPSVIDAEQPEPSEQKIKLGTNVAKTEAEETYILQPGTLSRRVKTKAEEVPDSIINLVQKEPPEMPKLGTLETRELEPDVPKVALNQVNKQEQEIGPPPRLFGTDASNFDIAGIKLGMDLESVIEITSENGFDLVKKNQEIPNFAKWQYEIECKNNGIYIFEGIQECVHITASKKNTVFIEFLSFKNKRTGEELEISFTSNYTGNKVKKIYYATKVDPSLGSSNKAKYIKQQWANNFWQRINLKYGQPDDKQRITWGKGEGLPMLVASTGTLVLVDPKLPQIDYALMYQADKGLNANFTF